MADESQPAAEAAQSPDRAALAKMFYDCKTQKEKDDLAGKFPQVREIFAATQFSS